MTAQARISVIGRSVFADGFEVAELREDAPAMVYDAFRRAIEGSDFDRTYAIKRAVKGRHAR